MLKFCKPINQWKFQMESHVKILPLCEENVKILKYLMLLNLMNIIIESWRRSWSLLCYNESIEFQKQFKFFYLCLPSHNSSIHSLFQSHILCESSTWMRFKINLEWINKKKQEGKLFHSNMLKQMKSVSFKVQCKSIFFSWILNLFVYLPRTWSEWTESWRGKSYFLTKFKFWVVKFCWIHICQPKMIFDQISLTYMMKLEFSSIFAFHCCTFLLHIEYFTFSNFHFQIIQHLVRMPHFIYIILDCEFILSNWV